MGAGPSVSGVWPSSASCPRTFDSMPCCKTTRQRRCAFAAKTVETQGKGSGSPLPGCAAPPEWCRTARSTGRPATPTARKGTVLRREGRWKHTAKALRREGRWDTRQRQCLGHEGRGSTRQRQCLRWKHTAKALSHTSISRSSATYSTRSSAAGSGSGSAVAISAAGVGGTLDGRAVRWIEISGSTTRYPSLPPPAAAAARPKGCHGMGRQVRDKPAFHVWVDLWAAASSRPGRARPQGAAPTGVAR